PSALPEFHVFRNYPITTPFSGLATAVIKTGAHGLELLHQEFTGTERRPASRELSRFHHRLRPGYKDLGCFGSRDFFGIPPDSYLTVKSMPIEMSADLRVFSDIDGFLAAIVCEKDQAGRINLLYEYR